MGATHDTQIYSLLETQIFLEMSESVSIYRIF